MDFVVDKKDLSKTSLISSPPLTLPVGAVLIKIERFALTANNISYAVTGDALGYWNFFPCPRGGRVPVWGIGSIVASRCPNVRQDQKVYGCFPMSHYVVMRPDEVTNSDFIDASPHRKKLPAVYNQYMFCAEDPFYTPRTQDAMMVLRPLYLTSWLLVDFFAQQDFCSARAMVISSASSKTSIGLAFTLRRYNAQRETATSAISKIQIIGLTSPGNLQFVESLGIYDEITLYNGIESKLDASVPTCFVDMAGNTKVTTRLHNHLGDNMKYSCLVGAAHVGKGGKPASKLPGARPKFFFAPSWTAQRVVALGGGEDSASKRRGLETSLHNVLIDYKRFVDWCLEGPQGWMHMEHFYGQDQVAKGYAACLKGDMQPDTAIIMSLWDDSPQTPRAKL